MPRSAGQSLPQLVAAHVLDTFAEEAFERAALRRTPQRYAVLEYLLRHPGHPTAGQIFQAIHSADPRASRVTVYNSLHALTGAGVVREVVLEAGPARYGANKLSGIAEAGPAFGDVPVELRGTYRVELRGEEIIWVEAV